MKASPAGAYENTVIGAPDWYKDGPLGSGLGHHESSVGVFTRRERSEKNNLEIASYLTRWAQTNIR
jgi:hypothetical protein